MGQEKAPFVCDPVQGSPHFRQLPGTLQGSGAGFFPLRNPAGAPISGFFGSLIGCTSPSSQHRCFRQRIPLQDMANTVPELGWLCKCANGAGESLKVAGHDLIEELCK